MTAERVCFDIPEDLRPQSYTYLLLLKEMWEMHLAKAAGYSGHLEDVWGNFRGTQEFGVDTVRGIMVRKNDKWSRIKSLVSNPANSQLPDEPLEATLLDDAAYDLIIISILREERVPLLNNDPTAIGKPRGHP